MCRLLAISSNNYMVPDRALYALDIMQDGMEESGFGLLLRGLGGPFEKISSAPILSGIFSKSGIKKLGQFMLDNGFTTKYKLSIKPFKKRPSGVPKRYIYLVSAYDYPSEWESLTDSQRLEKLTIIRMELVKLGKDSGDMIPFSFWPDTIIIKEIGNPLAIADFLNLNRKEMMAKIIMVQGEQNARSGKSLKSCSPSFLQGFATIVNGENMAAGTNREFLRSRGFVGYNGFRSVGDVFTDTLHYTINKLGLALDAYKHILTPLENRLMEKHPHHQLLKHIKQSCRNLIIDGPNCVIGVLPDHTMFMLQDRNKWLQGIVGTDNGTYVFSSDISGLDAALPKRDMRMDFQPMHMDIVFVGPERKQICVYRQTDPLHLPN